MLAAFLLYTILRVLIKNDKIFWRIVIAITVISSLLRFSGYDELFFFDYLRSALAVSLGMLGAPAPKIEFKNKKIWWLFLLPVASIIFYIVFYRMLFYACFIK